MLLKFCEHTPNSHSLSLHSIFASTVIMSVKPKPFRVGQWLPSDRKLIDKWLSNLLDEIDRDPDSKSKLDLLLKRYPPAKDEQEVMEKSLSPITDAEAIELGLHSPIEALINAILTDPEINMFFHQMFWQQTVHPNISGAKHIWCWQLALFLINYIMDKAPEFSKDALVGFPINAILNWPMATTAGFAAFLNDKVNKLFKDILNYWGIFLKSKQSCYVLSDDPHKGWFGEDAMNAMPHFERDFKCNPSKPHYGFKSWDDFFTRVFRHGIRPVADRKDENVIVNACESAPYRLSQNIKKHDYFWMKSQRYSVDFMLNSNRKAEMFYGGTIYQAFLSALSYHRWHSPVSGIVKQVELVDGSYYSQTHNIQDDPAAPNKSQGYICHVAARAIIYIEADNSAIGLMCFVAVGMAEVSSNEITVIEGQHVDKGQQIGMFHFGGSTHCLLFRPGVNLKFFLGCQTPGLDSENINVCSKIAEVQ